MSTRSKANVKPRVFISFDYDHDKFLKEALVEQGRRESSTFQIADWSVKRASSTWRKDARGRIRRCDLVIAICGYHTDTAAGVAEEITIAREEGKPVRLLAGHKTSVRKPGGCLFKKVYAWNHPNLATMTSGPL